MSCLLPWRSPSWLGNKTESRTYVRGQRFHVLENRPVETPGYRPNRKLRDIHFIELEGLSKGPSMSHHDRTSFKTSEPFSYHTCLQAKYILGVHRRELKTEPIYFAC